MRKRRGRKADLLSAVLFCLLVPLICTVILQQMQLDQLLTGIQDKSEAVQSRSEPAAGMQDKSEAVQNRSEPAVGIQAEEAGEKIQEERTAEEAQEAEWGKAADLLLPGIVAKEIPVTAEPEAVKAQCVIARTNLYDAWEKGTAEPAAFSEEELKTLWGEDFTGFYEKLEEYIASVGWQTLNYGGDYIYAAYHEVSVGSTRRMSELYPDVQMPYLVPVECHEDTRAEGYLSVYVWSREEFGELCRKNFPDCFSEEGKSYDADSLIGILSRDSAGYVLTVSLGEKEMDGESFRRGLSLPSACLLVRVDEEKVRIVTKGNGHGFGLSQYTAEQMAASGSTYEEILSYFYPGAELLTYKP
ncbi:MAG: SpoIID/LytB domain-containing protein [Roseburia sp.]